MEVIKRLRERRLNVWEQAKALADGAAEQNRSFSGEEQSQWDTLNAELDALDRRMKSIAEAEKRAKEAEDAFTEIEGRPSDQSKDARKTKDQSELRAFLTGAPGAPRHFDVKPDGPVDFRVLSKLTGGAGGNTVPTSFFDRLMAHLIEVSALIRNGAFVLNTTSGENLQVPKTTAHSTATIIAEAGTITASDPAFGQTTLGAFKYAFLMQASRELVEDSGVDLEGYLAMQAGRALGNGSGAHFVTGTGTGQPFGIVTQSTLGVTGGTAVGGAFTADNLIDLHYSVIDQYRAAPSCAWLMRDATVGAVRKLKYTSGEYIWQPGLQVGVPDLLLGKPVVTDPAVAAVGLSARSVAFGDFSQYFIRMVSGVRFERSDEFAFNTDLTTFRAIMRADGSLIDLTGAVKHFVGGAS